MAKNDKSKSRSAGSARSRQPVRKKGVPTALWLALGGLVVVLVGVFLMVRPGGQAAPAALPQVSDKPKLEVDRESIDFGTVPLNKPVKATFKLTNVGDKPLKIAETPQVKALEGCWPPQAVVGSTTIQPGQSTELSMEFMMHEGMDGPHDFRTHVKTNDPDQPDKELRVLSNWQ